MPGSPILYFDRSLGTAFPQALRMLKLENVIHQHDDCAIAGIVRTAGDRSLFNDKTPDDVWLDFVGQRGWIAFSQDYSMHREPAPLAAIRQHDVKVFYLWGAQATKWQKMRAFAAGFDRIMAEAATVKGPFVRRVTRTGSLEVVPI